MHTLLSSFWNKKQQSYHISGLLNLFSREPNFYKFSYPPKNIPAPYLKPAQTKSELLRQKNPITNYGNEKNANLSLE